MYISKKLKKKLKKIIRKPYYYVPPCPFCDSEITGRYIPLHRDTETNWAINSALENGELVCATDDDITEYNCFCVECNKMWYEEVKMKFLTLEEIDAEMKKRYTKDILTERLEELKENEIPKVRGVTGLFVNFVGRM